MRIAAVVVVYHPEIQVVANIQSYSIAVEKVWVLDNSESKQDHFQEAITKIPNCVYIYDGENRGISIRLNQACTMAIEEGFGWILTMDQDSSFEEIVISRYLSCIQVDSNKRNVAVYGVEFVSTGINTPECLAVPVNQLITSGSIVNLELFQHIGNFNEELFIDQVDFDYCYRSALKGYLIMQFRNVFMRHTMGRISEHRSLRSLKNTERSLHSPERLYYMTRNFLYVRAKYSSGFKEDIEHSKRDLLNRIKNNFLYNSKRFLVLRYILRGFLDYRQKKMGKMRKR